MYVCIFFFFLRGRSSHFLQCNSFNAFFLIVLLLMILIVLYDFKLLLSLLLFYKNFDTKPKKKKKKSYHTLEACVVRLVYVYLKQREIN